MEDEEFRKAVLEISDQVEDKICNMLGDEGVCRKKEGMSCRYCMKKAFEILLNNA